MTVETAIPDSARHRWPVRALRGWIGSIALACTAAIEPGQALPAPPPVQASGGITVQSQSGGTPNTVSGYLFAPLSQGIGGQILFLDVAANLNLGGVLAQQSNVNAGVSSRLGYRWLNPNQRWILGVNAGVDTRQAYSQYTYQAGIGAEALSRSVEFRANGYIPFSNQAEKVQSGWSNATLVNNQLLLDGWNQYVVSLTSVNLEAGVPLARWKGDSLWLYASYYYLDGDVVTGSSGVRGRAELRLGSQVSLGATLAYDNLFQLQASGYLRYGAKPLSGKASDAIDLAERNFFALRGLPMQRETDIRMIGATEALPRSVATNPGNGGAAWVVKCAGTTSTTGTANVQCANASLAAMLATAAANDVLLVGGGASSSTNLAGTTLRLPVGARLGGSGNAPTLATQFGPVNLTPIFGTTVGAAPSISNGVISIGSNTTISGLNFSNASITNYSTNNVVIAYNTFEGSYTDNPTTLATAEAFGAINVSANALPAIQLDGVSNLTVANNVFRYPQVQTYVSQTGTLDNGGKAQVCNQNNYSLSGTLLGTGNSSGLCLSGNAIRMNNSRNVVISGNTVTGALDEAFRINNPSGTLVIDNNMISNMRMGPDSNIGTAIIIGQNKGSSSITISNNSISDNSPGVYPIVTSANQTGVAVATAASAKKVNNIDPIEVGLCRGSFSYPRAQDLYADPNFSGNCGSKATMTITVSGTKISLPEIPGRVIKQDGDGIDFNQGNNSVLKATVSNNTISTLAGTGDNGITFDIRGTIQGTINIVNNSADDVDGKAIDLEFANTPNTNQPGTARVSLSGNVAGPATEGLLAISLTKGPGAPLSSFFVNGSGSNGTVVDGTTPYPNPYNSGNYPNLYRNNKLFVRP